MAESKELGAFLWEYDTFPKTVMLNDSIKVEINEAYALRTFWTKHDLWYVDEGKITFDDYSCVNLDYYSNNRTFNLKIIDPKVGTAHLRGEDSSRIQFRYRDDVIPPDTIQISITLRELLEGSNTPSKRHGEVLDSILLIRKPQIK